jgi:hypothetical protein
VDPVRVHGVGVRGEPDRYRVLDGAPQRAEVVGQVGVGQVGAHGGHAAADVHTHGGRREGLAHGDDGADGGALSIMDIGHHGDALDPRQAADVAQLPRGLGLDRPRVGPHPHGRAGTGERLVHQKIVGGTGSCGQRN